MRKESLIHHPGRARASSCEAKNRKLSAPCLISASTSSLITTATNSFTISHPTFRRTSTHVFPVSEHEKVVEISNCSKLSSSRTVNSNHSRGANILTKPWLLPLTTLGNCSRPKPLEKISLRGPIKVSSSSLTSPTMPSCCSTTYDSQRSSLTSETRDSLPAASEEVFVEDNEGTVEELTAEEIERARNIDKCLRWIASLPSKFSGMHILHERAPVILD